MKDAEGRTLEWNAEAKRFLPVTTGRKNKDVESIHIKLPNRLIDKFEEWAKRDGIILLGDTDKSTTYKRNQAFGQYTEKLLDTIE